MATERPQATQAELSVLEVLWKHGQATIRLITDTLYPEGGASHYATVQKLLERLEKKGLVSRRRSVVPHSFRAKVDRGRLIVNQLRDIADSFCDGALGPLVTHLVEEAPLTDDDIRSLTDLVKKLDEDRSSK